MGGFGFGILEMLAQSFEKIERLDSGSTGAALVGCEGTQNHLAGNSGYGMITRRYLIWINAVKC